MRHLRHQRLRALANSSGWLLPRGWEVPARYWGMRVLGTLEDELAHIDDWLPSDGVAVDVGANYGVYTYALSKRMSAVHAFEPNPQCAQVLRAWAPAGVHVHEVALSDSSGSDVLTVPVTDNGAVTTQGSLSAVSRGNHVTVAKATLDDYALDDVGFIKIDVEGHELAVIQGGTETILRCRPIILMEIVERLLGDDAHVSDVATAVVALGYAGTLLTPDGPVPAEAFDPAMHQPFESGVRGEGYCNMFVFYPHRGASPTT